MFINDFFVTGSPAPRRDDWRPTRIGNRVNIGTNATILSVSICDQVVIGAGAVVTKDITEAGFYVGKPRAAASATLADLAIQRLPTRPLSSVICLLISDI